MAPLYPQQVCLLFGLVAQLAEHLVHTQAVGGSSPSGSTTRRATCAPRPADVTQLVECQFPRLAVASSSLVVRSGTFFGPFARVAQW